MTVSVTHPFVSAKSNGTDNTLVQPSNWNAVHTMSCAANSVVGNSTGSSGAVAEVPMGSLGATVLAANVLADLIAAGVPISTTGDIKFTLKTVADSGWLMFADQTIGNTSSGATYANTAAEALYTLLWTNVGSTYAPVTGGYGASAAADWSAQKPMQLLRILGRALGVAGSGAAIGTLATNAATVTGTTPNTLNFGSVPSWVVPGLALSDTTNYGAIPAGAYVWYTTSTTVVMSQNVASTVASGDTITFGPLSARNLGETFGQEEHGLIVGELPAHNHAATDSGHTHPGPSITVLADIGGGPQGGGGTLQWQSLNNYNTGTGYANITVDNTGGGAAANIMQPTTFLNAMVKL